MRTNEVIVLSGSCMCWWHSCSKFGISSYPKTIEEQNACYPVLLQHNKIPEIINLLRENFILFYNFLGLCSISNISISLDSSQGSSSKKNSPCKQGSNRKRGNTKILPFSPNSTFWGHLWTSLWAWVFCLHHSSPSQHWKSTFSTWKLNNHSRGQEPKTSNCLPTHSWSLLMPTNPHLGNPAICPKMN